MYSENYGVSWGIVARNVFTLAHSDQYSLQDFNWYSGPFKLYVRMYVILYIRGEPGIDWDINNPSQSKVFYSVIDLNVAYQLYSKYHVAYIMCVCVCVRACVRACVRVCVYVYDNTILICTQNTHCSI